MDQNLIKSCLVVDDEPLAREVLEEYIHRVPELKLAGSCKSGVEALSVLRKKQVDILFCDIKMPELNGLELIKTLDVRPAIILTTAYSEYAVEGFDIGVSDYLLKPIRFERFLKAVGRAIGAERTSVEEKMVETPTNPFLFFKVDGEFIKVNVTDIRHLEAYGNYVKIFIEKHPLVVHEKISTIEDILKPFPFVRIHKSFIVPVKGIKKLNGNEVLLNDGDTLPVGSFYKKELLAQIAK